MTIAREAAKIVLSMRKWLLSVMLAALFAPAGEAAGKPARYLVFEVDRADQVTLFASHDVEIDGALDADGGQHRFDADPSRVDVVVRDAAGEATFQTSVALDRFVRHEEVGPDGAMSCRWIEQERTAFAVRIPAESKAVELSVRRSGRQARFDLPARPAALAAVPDGAVRSESGTRPSNRLDLLVVGDGYTVSDAVKFERDVACVLDEFFSIEPYQTYRAYAAVATLFVPSEQSGADHPPCADGNDDPLEGTFVDTAFDATFCTSGLQRLLTVNGGKVLSAAAAVPDWDHVVVLVNDTMYGGAGGSFSVTSMHESAVPVLQHEFGHSFSGLADEYSTPNPGFPPCSDRFGVPCEANVTDHVERASIKWAPWIDPSTPLPTPGGFEGIGLFEGARYESGGMFRPAQSCLMNELGSPFCAVCTQAFVLRLRRGWGGIPTGGVDAIDDVVPSAGEIHLRSARPFTFRASLIPGRSQSVQWRVDGSDVEGATEEAFVFTPSSGTHTVELRVVDHTPFVHPDMAQGALENSRRWTVVTSLKRRAVGR